MVSYRERKSTYCLYMCKHLCHKQCVHHCSLLEEPYANEVGLTRNIHYKNFFFSYFLYDTVFCRVFVFSLMRKIILHSFFLYSFYSTHSVNTCTLAKLCKIFEGFVERFDRCLFIHVVVVEMQVE